LMLLSVSLANCNLDPVDCARLANCNLDPVEC